ncbi:serine kinase [Celeribacter arenosi]|uniref:HPr kinase/phosphatase C-terminal domain-containing protein n=1 Tax=Celeribacter arenosi TaxID=792649 RepID=A0ABP7K042_9RHOB
MTETDESKQIIHASCVALNSATGLLICGPSGSGKSTLALSMMALGACLVSDDRTVVSRDAGTDVLRAEAPGPIRGQIEARGVGILGGDPLPSCHIKAVVDLTHEETDRLPPMRTHVLIGVEIPMFLNVAGPHFPPALIQWLKGGRVA